MLLKSKTHSRAAGEQRHADTVTHDLLSKLIAEACRRPSTRSHPQARINELIAAGAWTDAALALIELERPEWTLRRLVYDGAEWHCALSRHSAVPLEFDESADASHEYLPMAIMSALFEARHISSRANTPSTAPSAHLDTYRSVMCDNFS